MTMRQNNFWAATALVLLLVLVAVFIPGDARAQSTSTQEALAVFSQVFRFIENNYVDEIETQVLLEGALKGLLESLDDPHSAYLNELAVRDLDDTTSGKFGGVGMYISKQDGDEDDDLFIEIIAPIEDTPSDRIGIRAGDVILEIEGATTADMEIEEAVSALRGTPGSKVLVMIERGSYTFPITITRAIIEVPTIRRALIPEYGAGYIRIIQFTPFTAERVRDALVYFKENNYESLIVDIRQNPGGLLSSSIEVADIFLADGLIVGTSGRGGANNEEFFAESAVGLPADQQVIVLIDKGSASASEIFAAALKDNGRALIIGQTSYGKGSVQQIRRIGDGGIRLTMSRYYTPSGSNIDSVGVAPDVEVEDTVLTEEQTQDYTALLSSGHIIDFVGDRKSISQGEIDTFVAELEKESSLTHRYIQKLVRDEIDRVNNDRKVYDLEFDLVLQRALEFL